MWADVLTKLLQGAKFCTMRAFLMNRHIDHSKNPPFVPSHLPTLSPTLALSKPQKSKTAPTMYPTSLLIKPQISTITSPSWVCVETQSHDTKYKVSAMRLYPRILSPQVIKSVGRMHYFHTIPCRPYLTFRPIPMEFNP
jgi:hypothetical protein